MKPGQTEYLGDGAYLRFTGHSFEFLANSHDMPTDRVSVDLGDVRKLLRLINETMGSADPIIVDSPVASISRGYELPTGSGEVTIPDGTIVEPMLPADDNILDRVIQDLGDEGARE